MMTALEGRINDIHNSINTTIDISNKLKAISEQLEGDEASQDLKDAADSLSRMMKEWQSVVIEFRQKGFQDVLNWPAGMNSEYFMLRNNLDTYDPKVPDGYATRMQDLDKQWADHKKVLDKIMNEDVVNFNAMFSARDLPALPELKTIDP